MSTVTTALFADAKAQLLATGQYPTTLVLEYTDANGEPCVDCYQFVGLDQEQAFFFSLGKTFGDTHGTVEFSSLALLFEAWISRIDPGQEKAFKRKYRRPHDDPQRREYLLAQIVTLEPSPSGKRVIDLVAETEEICEMGMLFPAFFLSGYALTQVPEPTDLGKMR